MKYSCNICDYATNDRRVWGKHIKTFKHNKNVAAIRNKNNTCEHCGSIFIRESQLVEHLRNCAINDKNLTLLKKEKDIAAQQIKINEALDNINNFVVQQKMENMSNDVKIITMRFEMELEKEKERNKFMEDILKEKDNKFDVIIKEKDSALKTVRDTIDILSKENQFHRDLFVGMQTSDSKNINGLTYVINNYSTAPKLEYNKKLSSLVDTDAAVDILIRYNKNNTLQNLISDSFVKVYKTNDPNDQSLWSTDVSRVNFLVREFVKEHDKDMWIVDKKGIKITSLTLTPLINHMTNVLDNHLKEYGKMAAEFNAKLKKNNGYTAEDYDNNVILLEKIKNVVNLKEEISNSTFAEDILRKITPHFFCNKNSAVIRDCNDKNKINLIDKSVDEKKSLFKKKLKVIKVKK